MIFNILILAVDRITKLTKAGKNYIQLDVSFKNLDTGKVEARKIMPFGDTASTHKTLNDASPSNIFTITAEKNQESGYWDWLKAEPQAPGSVVASAPQPNAVSSNNGTSSAATPYKSTYETPEERAKKQVYIVKQSSLSAAIATLSINIGKEKLQVESVLELAQTYTDWVFSDGKVIPGPQVTKSTSFDDMDNDIPL